MKELQPFHYELLDLAVRCVSQFDKAFAREIWNISAVATTRRLQRLERAGVITGRNVLASKPPEVDRPLCRWKPGEPLPHAGKASYQARKRWKSLPVTVLRVYYATDLGRGLLGRSPIKPPKGVQATHDLGLAKTFLAYRRRWPKLTQHCWLNESEDAEHRARFVKVEDAMLRRGDSLLQMVDYAGAYRPDRIEALLGHANYHNVPIAIF